MNSLLFAAHSSSPPLWLMMSVPAVFLAAGVLAGVVIILRSRASRRRRSVPGSSTRTIRTYTSTVRFDDVAGCDEAVDEVREMVDFLRVPERFARVGARIPSSVLLFGPPGTGKTLIAKALAGEAGVPFFAVSGSELIEMYVGVGAKRIRDLFARARKCESGAVIFIDEIDAIGRHRSSSPAHGGNDEREQTLNQLLVELDGFDTSTKVVVIAATNRIDILDRALLRPGRFGRQIPIDAPSRAGREEILRLHAAGKPLAGDVDFELLAESTAGMAGADLAEVVNEGAILAARADASVITHRNMHDGVLRVLLGPEKRNAMIADGELEVVAFHEAGHALAAELCPNHDKPLHATVRPRGRAGGFVYMGRTDRAIERAELIHEQMVVALAGRAAEQTVFGTVSSGAANDLEQVNAIARRAVEKLGLSPDVGQLVSLEGMSRLSEQSLGAVDLAVERLVHEAYEDALGLVAENRDSLERLARLLIAQKDLERVDILGAVARPGAAVALRPRLGTRTPRPVAAPRPAELHVAAEGRGRLRERLRGGAGTVVAAFARRAPA